MIWKESLFNSNEIKMHRNLKNYVHLTPTWDMSKRLILKFKFRFEA